MNKKFVYQVGNNKKVIDSMFDTNFAVVKMCLMVLVHCLAI